VSTKSVDIEELGLTQLLVWQSVRIGELREIDMFLVHCEIGPFLVEIKGPTIDQVQSIENHVWETKTIGKSKSPIHDATHSVLHFSNFLRDNGVEELWITPTVLWTSIDREEWVTKFHGNVSATRLADEMIFRDECHAGGATFEDALLRVRRARAKTEHALPQRVSNETLKVLIELLGGGFEGGAL
jgi:hypothetical protein